METELVKEALSRALAILEMQVILARQQSVDIEKEAANQASVLSFSWFWPLSSVLFQLSPTGRVRLCSRSNTPAGTICGDFFSLKMYPYKSAV